jgi:hypothetical protein
LCSVVGLINKYVVAAAVIERRMADVVPNKTMRSWTEENCVTKFTNCKLLRGGKIVEVITKSVHRLKASFDSAVCPAGGSLGAKGKDH